jgi:hypothetical protein
MLVSVENDSFSFPNEGFHTVSSVAIRYRINVIINKLQFSGEIIITNSMALVR